MPNPPERSDERSSAERTKWRRAVAENTPWLRTVVYSRLGEPAAVDDVMQQVALAALEGAPRIRDSSRIGPWLYRVAVLTVLQYKRSSGRRRKLIQGYAERTQPSEQDPRQADPLEWLLAKEQKELVRRALQKLPRRDAEVLLLKHTQNWTYAEIAARLGLSQGAVVGRLHRARERLRSALATELRE